MAHRQTDFKWLTVFVQDLGVHCELNDSGYWQLSLFSPYWMINKTQTQLTYQVRSNSSVLFL